MCRLFRQLSVGLLTLVLLPSVAYAQAAITGVVKDASGGVLPGVTVEASSPVLIEKVRSVVTDASGQYRVVDLRPGTYTVTFSLPGFSTTKREGIELTGTFVATINGDLRVGALAETITVTGETPIVDVQSAQQQRSIGKDVLATVPTGRQVSSVSALIPGISARSDVGGATVNPTATAGTIHGGQGNDTRSFADGLNIGWNGSAANQIMPNIGGSQEVVITTSGGLGESDSAGVQLNIIPRDGSNAFSGSFSAAGSNRSMQSTNYTSELKDLGLKAPNEVIKNYDINPMFGGRVIRNKLWFYTTARRFFQDNSVAGMFYNNNAGLPASDPRSWVLSLDESRQAHSETLTSALTMRLTYQASPRNKFNVYWDEQGRCVNCVGGGTALVTPEATAENKAGPTRIQQATWQSPVTNKILLDAGFGTYLQRYGERRREDGTFNPDLIQATEQAGTIPGVSFRSPTLYWHDWVGTYTWRGSVSYVSGAHSMKVGYQDNRFAGTRNRQPNNPSGVNNYQFSSGVPNRITVGSQITSRFVIHPLSLYAQDSWTRGRLTLQGGVRYDWGTTNFSADPLYAVDPDCPQIGPSPLIKGGIIQYCDPALLKGVNFKDVTPRAAAAYDLFGNGKTALKASVGRYVSSIIGDGYAIDLNPVNRALGTGGGGGTNPFGTTRSWDDKTFPVGDPRRGNLVPDCDLTNAAKNGECGAYANQTFGTIINGSNTTFTNNYDPAITNGWGVRPYEWDVALAVQHALAPRVSLNVGYFRRWYGNFLATDNRSVLASDFDKFSVTVVDPKLPDGTSTVTDLYNVSNAKFGLTDNIVTAASNFGKQIQHWNGVDVGVTARLSRFSFQAGTSTGRQSTDTCEIRAALPETTPTSPYCHVDAAFQTDFRGNGTYTAPKVDIQISANFSSVPGASLSANYNANNAAVLPSLGRPLSGGVANVSVPLVQPFERIGARTNQLDLRVAKVLRYNRTRTQIGIDLYNIANHNTVQAYNQTFIVGGSWLTPTSILPARLLKISAQFDF